jgi:hypothetical protein
VFKSASAWAAFAQAAAKLGVRSLQRPTGPGLLWHRAEPAVRIDDRHDARGRRRDVRNPDRLTIGRAAAGIDCRLRTDVDVLAVHAGRRLLVVTHRGGRR